MKLARSGEVIAERLTVANHYLERLRGLLFRSRFPSGEALFLQRCGAIHTWFMAFSIDVAFLDEDFRVVALFHAVRPWRIAYAQKAAHTVEFPAGELEGIRAEVGQEWQVLDALGVPILGSDRTRAGSGLQSLV